MEFEVVGEYIDKAMTGTNANRKNFLRMIEDSKSRTFRYVIVYANNRFARLPLYRRLTQNAAQSANPYHAMLLALLTWKQVK